MAEPCLVCSLRYRGGSLCAGALLVLLALALPATPAAAQSGPGVASCHKAGGAAPVTVTLTGSQPPNVTFTRTGSELAILTAAGPVACGPDSSPELSEVTSVGIDDQSFFGGPDVTIDQANGPLGPGAGAETGAPEIEFDFNIPGLSDNALIITPLPNAADVLHLGALPGGARGANLNGDGDGDDVEVNGIKRVVISGDRAGESQDDRITLDGSEAYFSGPFSVLYPSLGGGGGDDTIVAGSAGDLGTYVGGDGDDTIIGGAAFTEIINGGAGRDVLRGGAGNNRIDARDAGPDTVSCDGGDDQVQSDEPGVDDVAADCERVEFTPLGDVIVNGGAAVVGGQAQAAPLRLRVLRRRIPDSVAGLIDRGVALRVRCNRPCRAKVVLKLPKGVAERLGIRRRIGSGVKSLEAGQPGWLSVRLGERIAERLRGSRGFKVAILISASRSGLST